MTTWLTETRRTLCSSKILVRIAVLGVVGATVAGVVAFVQYRSTPLLTVLHMPATYSRRAASLSANVTASVAERTRSVRFRVNGQPWHQIDDFWVPRFAHRVVTLEMPAEELAPGINTLEIRAVAPLRPEELHELTFRYDPSPIPLPLRRQWQDEELEAQDGYWEAVEVEGQWRTRPRPGYEGYDRLLLVTGSFPAPRRIETYAVFREAHVTPRNEVGFGVLSLWAGHPGDWSHLPRAGWSFAMGLYWSKPGGVGSEISHHEGREPPKWVNSYRNAPLIKDERYHMIIEVEDVRAGDEHQFFRQRVKIWPDSEPKPEEWIVLTDQEGASLPDVDYGVALYTLDCQVEFGPVHVRPLVPTEEEHAE